MMVGKLEMTPEESRIVADAIMAKVWAVANKHNPTPLGGISGWGTAALAVGEENAHAYRANVLELTVPALLALAGDSTFLSCFRRCWQDARPETPPPNHPAVSLILDVAAAALTRARAALES